MTEIKSVETRFALCPNYGWHMICQSFQQMIITNSGWGV